LREARRLIDTGRAAEAVVLLEPMAESSADARRQRGLALYHADRHLDAVTALQPIVGTLAPDGVERQEVEQVLGLSLFLAGRFADAIPYLERTRTLTPENRELHFTLGQAYIQVHDAGKARTALARSFGLSPESAAACVAAAQLMIRLQMETLAEAELKTALTRDLKTPRANFLLGQLALFRGRLDDAVRFTEAELAINPTDAMALAQLGDAHVRASRWEPAIAALQQSIWLNPFYSAPYILLGRAYMQKDQPATAEGMLRRAIAYDPNNRGAHYLLGQLLQRLGRSDEARAAFATAEKLQKAGR
jgi:tetratricopeptide (TPR) repeat protein